MFTMSDDPENYKGFCNVCGTLIFGRLSEHENGRRHQQNLRHPPAQRRDVEFPSDTFCDVCNAIVGGNNNMEEHVRGRKHLRMMRKRKHGRGSDETFRGGQSNNWRSGGGGGQDDDSPDRSSMPPPTFRPAPRSRGGDPSSSSSSPGGAGGQTSEDRPPPHLKGRALGLWYRDRQRSRPKKEKEIPPIPLELGREKLLQIKRILGNFNFNKELSHINFSNSDSTGADKYENIKDSAFKHRFLKSVTGSLQEKMKEGVQTCNLRRQEGLDESLKREFYEKTANDRQFNEMLKFRRKLPAFDKRNDIIQALEKTNAILVSGETGCGKTTQVAQFILENQIELGLGSTTYIICTQPRRISAISVADRVAAERGERLGRSVGYQIRLERVMPRDRGSILFCTTGVLLQMMHGDPLLKQASHVIIDEVHERDTLSDFVITLLRDILPVRTDLKMILMSATLNADKFSKYLNNCPTIHIPGFTFPVKEYYLEDVLQMTGFRLRPTRNENRKKAQEREATVMPYIRNLEREKSYSRHVVEDLRHAESEEINMDLIVELILRICKDSPSSEAILVFMTGWDKISRLNKMLTEDVGLSSSKYVIIPLHSLMPTTSQRTVFDRPPSGKRKIVIATNIAETSITIDDIVHVIDCGKIKMKNFDVESNISTLKEEWVSLANARQRRGRAGRVQEGYCYHLFTRGREKFLEPYQLPEMVRTRLEEVILQLKILQLGRAEPFLSKVLDPPDPRALQLSIKLLKGMRALDDDEDLTPLGYHLANLPVDPQAGKMLLFAAMFSCFDPICSIAACLSFKDPFLTPLGKEKEVDARKRELCGGLKSDHLLLAEVTRMWEKADSSGRGWDFARANFLSYQNLKFLRDMKQQFAKQLHEMNYLPDSHPNTSRANYHSNRSGLVKAILCAGLYPNIAIIVKQKRKRTGAAIVKIRTPEDGRVVLHPKSVNATECEFGSRYLVYYEKIKSSDIFLHDTTMVTPLAILFFCQKLSSELSNNRRETILTVNDHIRFICSHSTADLIQDLRKGLDWILEYKISHPGITDLSSNSDDDIETRLIKAIIELITIEDEEVNYEAVDAFTDSDN